MKKIARNMILCALMTMSLSAVCLAEDTTATTTAAEPQATATVTATTQAAPDQNVVDWLDPAAANGTAPRQPGHDHRRQHHQRLCRYGPQGLHL